MKVTPRILTLLLGSVVVAATWYTITNYPLEQESEEVISRQGAPSISLELNPGDTAQQTFRTTQPLISAVIIFSTSDKIGGSNLTLTITDEFEHVLASSTTVRPSYDEDILRITFPLDTWIELPIGSPLALNITNHQGGSLELFALTENTYRTGSLAYKQQLLPENDISVALSWPTFLSSGARQGVIAGLVLLVGALTLSLMPSHRQRTRWILAALLIIIVTPVALGGFWQNQELLGIDDWDYYFSIHEVLRRMILTHDVFPFWNPYICGGTAGLADPEFPFFTITFLAELIFGIPTGLRLAALLSTGIGALGMLALGKRIGLSPLAALLAALSAYFGSVNLLEIVEGHPNVFAAMWIPWIFWSWLAAYQSQRGQVVRAEGYAKASRAWSSAASGGREAEVKRRRDAGAATATRRRTTWPLVCGLFLALTFYQGGIYLLFYTTVAFGTLILLTKRRKDALFTTIIAGLWALGFAAVKLIPALLWLSQFQDTNYAASTATLSFLHEILFGRHLHGAKVLPNQAAGWHEYGAYIGPLVLALALLGLTRVRQSRLVRALAISTMLALLLSSAGPALKPLFDQLPFIPRSTISRVILFAIIPLALLAGIGLDQLTRWQRNARIITPSLVGIAAVVLMSLIYPLSEQAFIVPRDDVHISPAPPPIAFTIHTNKTRIAGIDHTRSYLATLAGYGTLNYCTPLSPDPNVVAVEHSEDSAAVVLGDASKGVIEIAAWSPNRVTVHATITQPTDVILNTNYAKGWTVNNQPAKNIAGRVGTSLPPGEHELEFRYRTPGFIPGLVITLGALVAAVVLALRRGQRGHSLRREP